MALILHARDTALRPASTNSCQWRYIELCLRIFRSMAKISGLLQNWLQVSWRRRKILLNWLGTAWWWNWIALSSRMECSASLRWWEWICVYLCVMDVYIHTAVGQGESVCITGHALLLAVIGTGGRSQRIAGVHVVRIDWLPPWRVSVDEKWDRGDSC